jgi:hypothetical protein
MAIDRIRCSCGMIYVPAAQAACPTCGHSLAAAPADRSAAPAAPARSRAWVVAFLGGLAVAAVAWFLCPSLLPSPTAPASTAREEAVQPPRREDFGTTGKAEPPGPSGATGKAEPPPPSGSTARSKDLAKPPVMPPDIVGKWTDKGTIYTFTRDYRVTSASAENPGVIRGSGTWTFDLGRRNYQVSWFEGAVKAFDLSADGQTLSYTVESDGSTVRLSRVP